MLPTVDLYDPASPGAPVTELAANFHPGRHTRWEHRPAAAEVTFHHYRGEGAAADAPPLGLGIVTETQGLALHRAGIRCLVDVLGAGSAGLREISGVTIQAAGAVMRWASEHPSHAEAAAEAAAQATDADPPEETPTNPASEDEPDKDGEPPEADPEKEADS